MRIDEIDIRILRELQKDADQTTAQIAEAVHLSLNTCWRRIKVLQESGVIRKTVALLDAEQVNKGMTIFVEIRTSEHSEEWFEKFVSGVRLIPEVVELHRLSGHVDYLLKLLVSDIPDYDRVYKKIVKTAPLHDVTSYISMECIKETTEVPLGL